MKGVVYAVNHEQAQNLISKLTYEEKISLMQLLKSLDITRHQIRKAIA